MKNIISSLSKVLNKEQYCWYIIFFFIIVFIFSFNLFFSSEQNLKKILTHDNCIKHALFPTKDNITQILVDLISNEKKSVKICTFLLTDKNITNALVIAKEKGIDIEVVACHTNLENPSSKLKLLQQAKIPIYIFHQKNRKKFGNRLMHNKTILFEQNIDNKQILWTGSFNFTISAQKSNRENVIILDDSYLIDLYKKEFEDLKNESNLTSKIKRLYKYNLENDQLNFFGKVLRAFKFV